MPAQKAIITTMKTPVDSTTGERKDIFPRTVADAVRYTKRNGDTINLSDFIREKIEDNAITADDIPYVSRTAPNHACLWARVISEE